MNTHTTRTRAALAVFAALLALAWGAGQALAQAAYTAEVNRAVEWMKTQQQPDGSAEERDGPQHDHVQRPDALLFQLAGEQLQTRMRDRDRGRYEPAQRPDNAGRCATFGAASALANAAWLAGGAAPRGLPEACPGGGTKVENCTGGIRSLTFVDCVEPGENAGGSR